MDNQTQEPVAWMYEDELLSTYPYDVMFQYSAIRDGVRMFPVFHPAPSWQGLSDHEIQSITWKVWGADALEPELDYAHAIEAKLKEKNHVI